jgi:hypothetical protein
MAGVVINTGSRIGRFAIVNTGATVDHDNLIEDGVHISPGCHLAGNVICRADAFIGTGTSVIPRIRSARAPSSGGGSRNFGHAARCPGGGMPGSRQATFGETLI